MLFAHSKVNFASRKMARSVSVSESSAHTIRMPAPSRTVGVKAGPGSAAPIFSRVFVIRSISPPLELLSFFSTYPASVTNRTFPHQHPRRTPRVRHEGLVRAKHRREPRSLGLRWLLKRQWRVT